MVTKNSTNIGSREIRILDVGSGNKEANEGLFKNLVGENPYRVTRCDIIERDGIHFLWDITQPPPKNQIRQYDIVTAVHVIEHISFHKTIEVLKNILKPLKKGGILYIAVPSLEWAMEEVYHNRADYRVQLVLYGMQNEEYQYHKAAFTVSTLRQLINATKEAIVRDAFHAQFYIRYGKLEFNCLQNCFICEKL